ncbi:MAG: hypothetical protein ACRDV0_02355 [Acidimicrobiales bacterium]
MSTALRVVVGAIVLVAVAVVALRVRKLRRDEQRLMSRPLDRRLVTPPPSPYRPSQGFRLLDGAEPLSVRPTPERPRLEADHDYVFSELSGTDDRPVLPSRHDARWALERSGRRRAGSLGARALATVLVLAALASGVGYALHHRTRPRSSTTTTSSVPPVTTTTLWPRTFTPVSGASGHTYDVPAPTYEVTVTASAGAVWAVYRMGAANTLEFQGTVGAGAHKSLVMTGPSEVTLGSPHNATVSVGGSPVTFPSPLTSPLTLDFTPLG